MPDKQSGSERKGISTEMKIRRAEEKDSDKIMDLLSQVLEIHAGIRPDIFIPGTTKYTKSELAEILKDDTRPVYAAVDEEDRLVGYAFCMLQEQPKSENMRQFRSMYIDDLCVDETARGTGIGTALFEHVRAFARDRGVYNLTLNVWDKNEAAQAFYNHLGSHIQKYGMELFV